MAITPSAITVTEREVISVVCSTEGAPSPTYQWLRGGESYQNGGTLTIGSATPSDNTVFRCIATNNKGSVNDTIDVNVECEYSTHKHVLYRNL